MVAVSSDSTYDPASEIERLFRRWAALEVDGDLDAWLELVAEDAVLQPPGEPAVEGKSAIRAYASRLFELPIVRMEPGSLTTWVSESADLACIFGGLDMALEDESGREEQRIECLAVWRKVDGRWKVAVNSWSPNEAGA